LEGLLWHACFLRASEEGAATDALADLIAHENGVFKASGLAFGVRPDHRIIATTTATVGTMRSEADLGRDKFHPTGRNGKYTKLQVEGGPYKNRLAKHDTLYAPEVVWDAVGNGDDICRLLNFFITNVGQEASRGFGSVGRFQWSPLENDFSWKAEDGQLARILPVSIYRRDFGEPLPHQRVAAQTRPPYRQGHPTVESVAPARVRRIVIQ
jgi:hypothetical protein